MKKHSFIVLVLMFSLSLNSSCKYKTGHYFIIENYSELEIIPVFNTYYSVSKRPTCIKPETKFEYAKYQDSKIRANSSKNFENNNVADYLIENPKDTLYIGVFNPIDVDTMTCEEFKQKFPLKHEWKVTLSDMQACNWTLVYDPKK